MKKLTTLLAATLIGLSSLATFAADAPPAAKPAMTQHKAASKPMTHKKVAHHHKAASHKKVSHHKAGKHMAKKT